MFIAIVVVARVCEILATTPSLDVDRLPEWRLRQPAASCRDAPVPTTAQAAHQQALYLRRYLPALLAGKQAPAATYRDFGSLVSLGGFDAYGSLERFGFFDGGFIRGRVAQLGHAMLYRSYQARLHGLVRRSVLWLADTLARRVRPAARLS